ncbi:MAG TPA: LytR C-terminal domain-containing protein [Nocardioidaceae bacterium]|nr:LytR C-terminal domain-containing protein [Nocardioidaceae bacterium]
MRGSTAGRTTSSVVVVLSVVAIAAALVVFVVGGPGDDSDVAGDTASTSASAAKASSTPAGGSSDAAEAPKDQTGRAKKAKPSPEASPKPVVPSVYVEVYNMTSVSGLAGSTAAQLQDAGWQVVGIDNWRGNIPASTVYYPAGFADEATQLANTLGIGRVRGAVAPMKFDRLTVILTADAT